MTAFFPCMLSIKFLDGETGQDNRKNAEKGRSPEGTLGKQNFRWEEAF